MSEIAEIRKLFQDLIAPDVKSIATDLAAFKTNVDHQFKALKESIETKFDAMEAVEQARYLAVTAKIEMIRMEFASTEALHASRHESIEKRLSAAEAIQTARHEAVLKALDIDKRLERVEARQAATTAA